MNGMKIYRRAVWCVGAALALTLGHDLFGEFEPFLRALQCGCFGGLFSLVWGKNKIYGRNF